MIKSDRPMSLGINRGRYAFRPQLEILWTSRFCDFSSAAKIRCQFLALEVWYAVSTFSAKYLWVPYWAARLVRNVAVHSHYLVKGEWRVLLCLSALIFYLSAICSEKSNLVTTLSSEFGNNRVGFNSNFSVMGLNMYKWLEVDEPIEAYLTVYCLHRTHFGFSNIFYFDLLFKPSCRLSNYYFYYSIVMPIYVYHFFYLHSWVAKFYMYMSVGVSQNSITTTW